MVDGSAGTLKLEIIRNKHGEFNLHLKKVHDDEVTDDLDISARVDEVLAKDLLLSCLMYLTPSRDELETLYQLASDLNEAGFYADVGEQVEQDKETDE